jgi:tetratricopeptide (TPR) repeat protein
MQEQGAPGGSRASRTGAVGDADWPTLIGGAVIVISGIGAYFRTFSVPLLLDDAFSITDNPTIRHLSTAFWPPANSTVSGRPVVNLSLAVNYAISGTAVWSYHAVNLAIHIMAGLVLFGILRRTPTRKRFMAFSAMAFLAALLWTVHPLVTESVTYIVQRAESLMGLFYLLTLYCFVRGAAVVRSTRNLWYALSVTFCFLGMGTKEVMVSAPLIVFLYDRTFIAGSFREAWQQRGRIYGWLASSWLFLFCLVASTHGRGGTAGFGSTISWWNYGLSQFPAVAHYLRLCFLPYPLVFDYGSAVLLPLSDVLPSAIVVVGLLAATIWALYRSPAIGFLGASFFAILAPSSSIIPVVTERMAEHRMYIALIPVVVLTVAGIFRWLGRAAAPLCLAIAVLLICGTLKRNETYRSAEQIWADTVAKWPLNERSQNNLGNFLAKDPGGLNEAIEHYKEALRLAPRYADAHFNLGIALAKIPGRTDEAIDQFEEVLRLKPDYTEAHYNLGVDLSTKPGRFNEAVAHYEEAVRQKPDYAEAHYNLGCALAMIPGRGNEAVAEFQLALRLKPDQVEAHYNLGRVLEAMPGRLNEAIDQYEEAIRMNPGYAEAHFSLGSALQMQPGRLNEAVAQYEESLRLNPAFAQAHFNLGFCLERIPDRLNDAISQYQEAVRLKPDYAEAHYNLGCVLQSMPGRLNEAVAQYEETLRLQPGNVEARANLGNALNSLGRISEAVDQYSAALRLRPDDATIHINLAIVLLKLPDRINEAIAQLNEAIRIQPENQTARRILARIGAAQQ